jgi:hypothetical protein
MKPSITDYYWQDEQAYGSLDYDDQPGRACFYALETKAARYSMQSVVLGSNNPKWATFFAAMIPDADIPSLQAVVVKSGDSKWIVRFAHYISTANKTSLRKALIKTKSASGAVQWLKHIDPSAANALKTIIIKSGKPSDLLELARHITAPKVIKQVEDLLVKGKAIRECRIFAQTIKLANKKRLEKLILGSGNLKEIKALAKSKASIAASLSVLF